MPKTALDRLVDDDDDIAPQKGLPAWETHDRGEWHVLQTPKGLAVVHQGGSPRAEGMVLFADRTIVPLAAGPTQQVFNQAESVLREGRSGWALLELDVLDPDADKPAEPGELPAEPAEPREAPTRTGPGSPIKWNFR